MALTSEIAVFFVIGLALAAVYFGLLYATVVTVGLQQRPLFGAASHILRLAIAVAGFVLIAPHGAIALCAALAGFTVALVALWPLRSSS